MAEEAERQESSASAGGGGVDPAAIAVALGQPGTLDPRAATFLEKQGALADLQMEKLRLENENLQKKDEYETSHLRWRRFNEQMKGALQIMLVLLGLIVAGGIAWAIWSASQADGLVVDTFSVPPSYAQAGVSGTVMADDMTARIAAIRDFANDHSFAHSSDISEDHARDVKVEIPATGVSLADAWNYLKLWFGHERHLTGNLRTRADGSVALTVSLGGADSFTYLGKDLGSLEQQAAEQVFATVDPANIVLYLGGKGRLAETLAAARRNVEISRGNFDLPESYSLYANVLRNTTGDAHRSLAISKLAIGLAPKAIPQHMEALNSSRMLGYDEEVLKQAREIVPLKREDNVGRWSSVGFLYVKQLGAMWGDRETGDFSALSRLPIVYDTSPGRAQLVHAEAAALSHDPQGALVQIASAIATARALSIASDRLDPVDVTRARAVADGVEQDWRAAAPAAQAYFSALKNDPGHSADFDTLTTQTEAAPLLAQAQAHLGNFASAWATIESTPRDCYDCVRTRGLVSALQKNGSAAAYWFARAISLAPNIPFAYADWGAMLMAKGDLDAAIAKFASANQKGPHFADPLEMWGEALIAKNRSDLALAKFQEAAKYAPKWGRLHQKWGEALSYLGRKDEAAKQFALARRL